MKKILILGDKNIVMSSIANVCTERGWKVSFIENGAEALGTLFLERFDLLITPMFLAKSDATQILNFFKSVPGINDKIPVVLITSEKKVDDLFPVDKGPDYILNKNEQTIEEFKKVFEIIEHRHKLHQRRRVLYIDDDKLVLKMVQLWLCKFAYIELDVCSSLDELKQKTDFSYDLIATDHFLQDGTSTDVVEYITMSGGGTIPIVVYTATVSNVDLIHLQQLGNVLKVFPKPFAVKAFVELL